MKVAQGQLRRLQGGPRGLVLSALDHILTKAFMFIYVLCDYICYKHPQKKNECFLEIRLPEQLCYNMSRGSFAETTTVRCVLYPSSSGQGCVFVCVCIHSTVSELHTRDCAHTHPSVSQGHVPLFPS